MMPKMSRATTKTSSEDVTRAATTSSVQRVVQSRGESERVTSGSIHPFWDGGIYSKAHWFSRRTSSSSSGVKSFLMLNVLRISSGVLPAPINEGNSVHRQSGLADLTSPACQPVTVAYAIGHRLKV